MGTKKSVEGVWIWVEGVRAGVEISVEISVEMGVEQVPGVERV